MQDNQNLPPNSVLGIRKRNMIAASEKYDYCLILSLFEVDHFLKMYKHKRKSQILQEF